MIRGAKISLRPATEDDRYDVYDWLVDSDVTPSMMGPPHFADVAVPTWDEFCADYESHFFDGSRTDRGRSFIIEMNGESVGHISYDTPYSDSSFVELDVWMRSLEYCGHGYGSDAMSTLMQHLHDQLLVCTFIVRPSLRNERAMRAYEKAGFRPSKLSRHEQTCMYGIGEYADTITLERIASH